MVRYKGESYSPGDPEYPRLMLMMAGWAVLLGASLGFVTGIIYVVLTVVL